MVFVVSVLEAGAGLCSEAGSAVFLSKRANGGPASAQFDCHDKIYLHSFFPNKEKAAHELSAEWINPKGRVQEYTAQSFSASEYKAWFWIKLHPGPGGKVLKAVDPSIGMNEFIGQWTVRLYLDGRLAASSAFFVSC